MNKTELFIKRAEYKHNNKYGYIKQFLQKCMIKL